MGSPITRTDRPDISKIDNFPEGAYLVNKGSYWYVVKREFFYKKELGRGSERRVYIGKIVDSHFYTNEEYKARFKRNGQPRTVPLEVKPATDEDKSVKADTVTAKSSQNRIYPSGQLLLGYGAIRHSSIRDDLIAAGFDAVTADTILSLALFNIIENTNAYYLYSSWCGNQILPYPYMLDPKAVTQTLRDIGQRHDLMDKLFKLRASRLHENEVLSVDSTSIECESEDISYKAVGIGKNKEIRNQTGYYVILGHKCKMPVMFRYLSGSTNDASTMADIIERSRTMDLTCSHVMDKGYYSSANMALACSKGVKVNISLKDNCTFAYDIANEHYDSIMSNESFLPSKGVHGRSFKHTLTHEGESFDTYVHVFCDQERRARRIKKFFSDLACFKEEWDKKDKYALADKSKLKYFTRVRDENGCEQLKINFIKVNTETRFYGFFINITSFEQSPESNFDDYSARECIEANFKMAKSEAGFKTVRAHSDGTLHGRGLINFVSSILLADIHNQMSRDVIHEQKNGKIRRTAPVKDKYTLNQLMYKLRNVMINVYDNGSCAPSEMSKELHEILEQMEYADAVSDLTSTYNQRKI